MRIISHRGYWKEPAEKNTVAAFERSFALGFGTETDVRDLDGTLVISHDPPRAGALTFSEFVRVLDGRDLPLALNVKSDGLAPAVAAALDEAGIRSAFVFDMSVPDMRGYLNTKVPAYTRLSEVERDPAWIDRSAGVWLDAFDGLWYDATTIRRELEAGRAVCVVSPELHGRDPESCWALLESLTAEPGLTLCTDLPEEALARLGGS